jgi:hypothetical protein
MSKFGSGATSKFLDPATTCADDVMMVAMGGNLIVGGPIMELHLPH